MPVSTIFTVALPWLSQVAIAALEASFSSLATDTAKGVTNGGTRLLRLTMKLDDLDEATSRLAWVTYVQLVTRISVVPLPDGHGFDREALSSLHALFGRLRDALEEAGPQSTVRRDRGGTPVGVAVAVLLNVVLRPYLSYWHPQLEAHEATRPKGASKWEHEQGWSEDRAFREQLALLQDSLVRFAAALEQLLKLEPLASLRELGPVPELGPLTP